MFLGEAIIRPRALRIFILPDSTIPPDLLRFHTRINGALSYLQALSALGSSDMPCRPQTTSLGLLCHTPSDQVLPEVIAPLQDSCALKAREAHFMNKSKALL